MIGLIRGSTTDEDSRSSKFVTYANESLRDGDAKPMLPPRPK